jgi:outer membrane protein
MYDVTPDKIYEIALQQLAIIKATHLRQQSAEKGVQAARGDYYPTLSLNGNVNTNYSNAALHDVFQNTSDVPSTDYVEIDGNQFPVIKQQDNFLSQPISYGDQVKNNVSTSVSLGLSIPILNSLQARHRVEQQD